MNSTVDLISYTVKALRPTTVEEAAQGSGGLCGGSFVNRRFARFLDDKFRNYRGFDAALRSHMLRRFEEDIKPAYGGLTDADAKIRYTGLLDNDHLGIKRQRVHITAQELKRVFDPVIEDIIKLVRAQIRATRRAVKSVLMAGGFGRSRYLQAALKTALERDDIKVAESLNWCVPSLLLISPLRSSN